MIRIDNTCSARYNGYIGGDVHAAHGTRKLSDVYGEKVGVKSDKMVHINSL